MRVSVGSWLGKFWNDGGSMVEKCAIPLRHGFEMFGFGGMSDGNDV